MWRVFNPLQYLVAVGILYNQFVLGSMPNVFNPLTDFALTIQLHSCDTDVIHVMTFVVLKNYVLYLMLLYKHSMFTVQGLRPDIPKDADPKLVDLMQRCWEESPSQRPSFSEIKIELEKILEENKVGTVCFDIYTQIFDSSFETLNISFMYIFRFLPKHQMTVEWFSCNLHRIDQSFFHCPVFV